MDRDELDLSQWQLGDALPDAETDAELAILVQAVGDHLGLGCVVRAGERLAALTIATPAIRAEAFEEAAKVADAAVDDADNASSPYDNGAGAGGYRSACYDIAERIRSLTGSVSTGEG